MATIAYIFDLDNTLYSVPEYGDRMFKQLFRIIEKSGDYTGDLQEIKDELMRTPMQKVAEEFSFASDLKEKCIHHLRHLTYDEPIQPFKDYELIRELDGDRFIVTMGFEIFQRSKIKAMNIEQDFKDVFVVDPDTTDKVKRDIFQEIIGKYAYNFSDVFIIGDDPESEIQAAQELGAHAVLFDVDDHHAASSGVTKVKSFREMLALVG
jgi:putative hydrolase of the HAD superfamily